MFVGALGALRTSLVCGRFRQNPQPSTPTPTPTTQPPPPLHQGLKAEAAQLKGEVNVQIEAFADPEGGKAGLTYAVAAMDKSEERPCCLCNVVDGDASPLAVKAPVFCTKNIGQSSPYPCDNNTISVTISATGPLYGNTSKIMISGLTGAEHPTGFMKLHDRSQGQRHELLFSPAPTKPLGFGTWDNNAKTLTLQVAFDLDCGGEYVFAFTVKNPTTGTDAPALAMIEAQMLHPNAHTYYMAAVAMVHDTQSTPPAAGANKGEAPPMRIRFPVFTLRNITQSSDVPCHLSTITVDLESTVPLFRACNLAVTIAGLIGSDTDDTPELPIVAVTADTYPFGQNGTWSKVGGQLVLMVEADVEATTVMTFSFELRNPAVEVKAAAVTISASGQAVFPGAKMRGTPNAKGMDPYGVVAAAFTVKRIGQSSPWPCDLNTLTVSLVSNTPLLASCMPEITITGLDGFQTMMTDMMNVSDGVSGGSVLAHWNPDEGKLRVRLQNFTDAATAFALSFVLRNPSLPNGRQRLPISLTGSMVTIGDMRVHDFGSDAATAEMDNTGVRNMLDNVTFAGRAVEEVNQTTRGPSAEDDDAGFLRDVVVEATASQRARDGAMASTPCAPIEIIVTMRSSVPLLTWCRPNVTISGLAGAPYMQERLLALFEPEEATGTLRYQNVSWNPAEGAFVMNVMQDTLAGQEFEIKFNLTQNAAVSTGVAGMTVATSGIVDSQPIRLGLGDAKPLKVDAITFNMTSISQQSPFPCDSNVLTVSLSASRDVHAGCHPRVTITGLKGKYDEMFQNPDTAQLPVTNKDDVSPVANGQPRALNPQP